MYDEDLAAVSFQTCKCGYPRVDHSGDTAGGRSKKAVFIPVEKEATGACGDYRTDLTANAFGQCICGFSREAHRKAEASSAYLEGQKKLADAEAKKKAVEEARLQVCTTLAKTGGG